MTLMPLNFIHEENIFLYQSMKFAIYLSDTPDAVAVIQKEFNLPTLALDGDQIDEMVFSDANIMNRIKS